MNVKLKLIILFLIIVLMLYCIFKINKARFESITLNESKSSLDNVDDVNVNDINSESLWNLILVNYKNPIDEDYVNNIKLKTISSTETVNLMVDERIYDDLKSMLDDAEKDGMELRICSAYRTIKTQQNLFNEQVKLRLKDGMSHDEAVEGTMHWVAKPGTSEHHTGLAIDIVIKAHIELKQSYDETEEFAWLTEHAQNYGFTMRYHKDKQDITNVVYEPWHWRHVGKKLAIELKNSHQCLEEYLNKV